jgi:alkyldihydroxyacetonephosphate synthase
VLAWCDRDKLAAIPFGGGSSCVGGVEARGLGERGVVSIDLGRIDRVIEIDRASRAARIGAGIYGPALEEALKPHGLTLRHYPQSFEFSTLGGWIATRSGGHFATLHTHIDDFVEAVRVITPRGLIATRRLPGSGAGPAPERLFLGSEGALGVITEAWMRLQDRPRFRASTTVRFADFLRAAECARALAQSGLWPQNCRLLDADEAMNNGIGDGTRHLLLVAFESADHPLDPWMDRALSICRELGGEVKEGAGRTREGQGDHEGAEGAWRTMFLRGPYLRDALLTLGMVVETFETAITWDRFATFHAEVKEAALSSAKRVAGSAVVSCRLTHVYPDGAAPYYTVIAPGKRGSLVSMWDEIKIAVSEAILANGGTITHHHAVGRDHRPFYDRERPDLFAAALRGAKAALDPSGIMNPGVLV